MSELFAEWPPDQLAQITASRAGSKPADQSANSLYLDATTRNPIKLIGEIRRARAFITSCKADVVYFRSAGWPLVFELLPVFVRVPIVTHVMDDWIESERQSNARRASVLEKLLRRTLTKSTARLAISAPMAVAYGERYGCDFDVVHAGAPESFSADGGVAEVGEYVVHYSGNVAPNQTADALVDVAQAVAALRERDLPVRFDLAPSTEVASELRRRFEQAGTNIIEQGTRADYLARLSQASIVLTTSNFDATSRAFLRYSLPNKIPELLVSGTPVLAYAPDELAYVQMAKQQGWAHVVDHQSPAELSAAIEQLLTDHELRGALLEASAEAARTTFSRTEMRERFFTSLTQHMGRPT